MDLSVDNESHNATLRGTIVLVAFSIERRSASKEWKSLLWQENESRTGGEGILLSHWKEVAS